MIFNTPLAAAISDQELTNKGFKPFNNDGDPRNGWMELENDKFRIVIDAWFEVKLNRKNPYSEPITVKVESKEDLDLLLDFIKVYR